MLFRSLHTVVNSEIVVIAGSGEWFRSYNQGYVTVTTPGIAGRAFVRRKHPLFAISAEDLPSTPLWIVVRDDKGADAVVRFLST